MGSCGFRKQKDISAQSIYHCNEASYPKKVSVVIKKRDSRGRINETEKVSIYHTDPKICYSEDLSSAFFI